MRPMRMRREIVIKPLLVAVLSFLVTWSISSFISAKQIEKTWYEDKDKDAYSTGKKAQSNKRPAGYKLASELLALSGDCNDHNATIYPGATEVPNNGVDENCNGSDLDTIGPTMEMTSPADGTTALLNTDIVVHVKDGSSGVSQGSIVMKVEGVTVTPRITGSASDYTLTYDPPADFTDGQEVNVAVSACDMAGNLQTQSFSFVTVSVDRFDCVGDDDCDGIPNGVEGMLGTDPRKKTLFVRPYKKIVGGSLVYWSDFSAVLFPDGRGTGFADILPFNKLDVEISVIGDPKHPYQMMRALDYDPATDSSHPACDILELVYNETKNEMDVPSDSRNKGHTYFNNQTWTWDTKGKTPSISLSSNYQKYKYHRPYAYALPLDRYFSEGAYGKIDSNEGHCASSGCGHTYCYEYDHCSPMNLDDNEPGPPYFLPPDSAVEMNEVVYNPDGKIVAIGQRGQPYDRNAVLKRTIVHEMGHAILGASNGDHCNEPLCILYHSTVGGWELLDFGGPGCMHGQSIFAGIHNSAH